MPANHCVPHTAAAKAKMSAARVGKPAPWKHRPTIERDGVTLYRCGSCAAFLPRGDYYANKRTLLGIKSQCKKCHCATTIASRDKDLAREANRQHMARARQADPQRFRTRDAAASAQRPVTQKVLARAELNAAVRSGAIKKPAMCSQCPETRRLHGHHDDYSKPLQVRWLCPRCHGKEHRK